jgi:hypothetical protein
MKQKMYGSGIASGWTASFRIPAVQDLSLLHSVKPPIQWVPGDLSLGGGLKRPGR